MLDYIKSKIVLLTGALLLSNYSFALSPVSAPDLSVSYVLIENKTRNEFFIMSTGAQSGKLIGASKLPTFPKQLQNTLGYMGSFDLSNNASNNVDIWLDNSFASTPFLGLTCFQGAGCPIQGFIGGVQDAKGVYKAKSATSISGGNNGGTRALATLSNNGYIGLSKAPLGRQQSTTLNWCVTKEDYDPSKAERCATRKTGTWRQMKFNYTKTAHLTIEELNGFSEIWVSSDGTPTLNDSNAHCKFETVTRIDGIRCQAFKYTFESTEKMPYEYRITFNADPNVLGFRPLGQDIRMSVNNNWLGLGFERSLEVWFQGSSATPTGTFDVFFSKDFFKKVIDHNGSLTGPQSIFSTQFLNQFVPETGYYDYSPDNQIDIKPREYGLSIRPEPDSEGLKLGDIGSNAPIDFNYKVTVSGPRNADKITAQVLGASGSKDGQNYCVFKPIDKIYDVLIPSFLSYMDKNNQRLSKRSSCGDAPISFQDAIWNEVPWDVAKSSFYYTTMLKLSFPMNDKVSQLTQANKTWEGQVYAEGTVKIKAEWLGVP